MSDLIGFLLVIALASCAAEQSQSGAPRGATIIDARTFVCDEIHQMVGVGVPESIVLDTLHDAVQPGELSAADVACLEGQAVPDGVVKAVRSLVRVE